MRPKKDFHAKCLSISILRMSRSTRICALNKTLLRRESSIVMHVRVCISALINVSAFEKRRGLYYQSDSVRVFGPRYNRRSMILSLQMPRAANNLKKIRRSNDFLIHYFHGNWSRQFTGSSKNGVFRASRL